MASRRASSREASRYFLEFPLLPSRDPSTFGADATVAHPKTSAPDLPLALRNASIESIAIHHVLAPPRDIPNHCYAKGSILHIAVSSSRFSRPRRGEMMDFADVAVWSTKEMWLQSCIKETSSPSISGILSQPASISDSSASCSCSCSFNPSSRHTQVR